MMANNNINNRRLIFESYFFLFLLSFSQIEKCAALSFCSLSSSVSLFLYAFRIFVGDSFVRRMAIWHIVFAVGGVCVCGALLTVGLYKSFL